MRILRFLKALFVFILRGETTSPLEENQRMEICIRCEHNLGKTCEVCGCVLKAKVKMSTESCPKSKW
jgi:hypothetical protein